MNRLLEMLEKKSGAGMVRVGLAVCTAGGKGFPGGTSITTVESQRPIDSPTPLAPGKNTRSLDHLIVVAHAS